MPHDYASRLIYAADINFFAAGDLKEALVYAAKEFEEVRNNFKGLGITIKGNTLLRAIGPLAFPALEAEDLDVFADYKLFDVRGTIANDLSWLRLCSNLKILTISEDVHPEVFQRASITLPNVIIAPINPLTDLKDADFKRRGEKSRKHAVSIFFKRVAKLPATGVICSPADLQHAPEGFTENREIITPAIRPTWATIPGDKNAANALTPREAILAGATRLVVGSPIRLNGDMRGNVERILDEIGEAMEVKNRS